MTHCVASQSKLQTRIAPIARDVMPVVSAAPLTSLHVAWLGPVVSAAPLTCSASCLARFHHGTSMKATYVFFCYPGQACCHRSHQACTCRTRVLSQSSAQVTSSSSAPYTAGLSARWPACMSKRTKHCRLHAALHRTPCKVVTLQDQSRAAAEHEGISRPAIKLSSSGNLLRPALDSSLCRRGQEGSPLWRLAVLPLLAVANRARPWSGWPRSRSSTPSCRSWAAHILHIMPISVQTPPSHITRISLRSNR